MSCDTMVLKRAFEQVRTARSNIEGVWDQVERFIAPLGACGGTGQRGGGEGAVEWNRSDVWDFTAIDGSSKLAASIHGTVTSPATRWFKLRFRDERLADDTDAQTWLDQVGDIVFNTLQESDFNTEIAASYDDFVRGGNMIVIEEPLSETEWQGLDFTGVPLREGFIELDSRGNVLRFWRWLKWTAAQIEERFEGSDRPLPERIAKCCALDGDPTQKFDVIFCIFERCDEKKAHDRARATKRDRAMKRAKGMKVDGDEPMTDMLAPEVRPVGFCYFLLDSGEPLGDEGGYYSMPAFHAPFEKTPGSVWGHGPAITALPTVKYLNALLEVELGALEKMVDPASLATERGLLSDLDLKPGGLTIVADLEKSLKPYESGARIDVSEKKATELRAMIRQLFHVDDLQLKDSPAMTATEASIRWELMNRVLGPTLGRLESGILGPIIKCAIDHLARAGQLPKIPDSVTRVDPDLDIEYQGPLSRAQRTDEVAAIERTASFVAALTKLGFKKAAATFDDEQATRLVAKLLGCPAALLKSPEKVKAELDQQAALEKRMQEATVAQQEGDAAQSHADAAASHAEAMQATQGAAPAVRAGPLPRPLPARPSPLITPPYDGAVPPVGGAAVGAPA